MATIADTSTRLTNLKAEYDRLIELGIEEYTLDGKKVVVKDRLIFISGQIKELESLLAQLSRRGSRYKRPYFIR